MSRLKTPPDPWHFPRPGLAAKYLQVFDIGLTSARVLLPSDEWVSPSFSSRT